MDGFKDGLVNFFNSLANRRNAQNQNRFTSQAVSSTELRSLFITGIVNKVIRLKVGHALNDTIQFETMADEEAYESVLEYQIKDVAKYMLGFGRGILVMSKHPKQDLTKARTEAYDPASVIVRVFSGDMVSVNGASPDVMNKYYNRPKFYNVGGPNIHHSHVVDFTYIKPAELDAATYNYGGVSESEFVYSQLMNDAVVQRATVSIVEKSSSLFYKIKGFKEAMQQKQETSMKEYYGLLEDGRSIYGAGLIDAEDDATVVQQQLSHLPEINDIMLRRMAMFFGVPLPILVGENVKGLNSSGENEWRVFQDTEESLESDYLKRPINQAMRMLGLNSISFKSNQGMSPTDSVLYDGKVIDNAVKMASIGEEYKLYLKDRGITTIHPYDKFFGKG